MIEQVRWEMGRLAVLLESRRYGGVDEATIQAGILEVLTRPWGEDDPAGWKGQVVTPEHRLGPKDRIDFFITPAGVGIEVKVAGTLPTLLRQLQRYMQHDVVRGLIVVTNRARLLDVPAELSGKPIAVASLLKGGL